VLGETCSKHAWTDGKNQKKNWGEITISYNKRGSTPEEKRNKVFKPSSKITAREKKKKLKTRVPRDYYREDILTYPQIGRESEKMQNEEPRGRVTKPGSGQPPV